MELGERIKTLRKDKSLSQDALAEAVGVSRQAVSKWEKGIARPDIDNVVAMSALFCVSTDYILTGHNFGLIDSDVSDLPCEPKDTFDSEILPAEVAASETDSHETSDNSDKDNNESAPLEKTDGGIVKRFSGFALGISLFSIGLTAAVIILIISAFTPNLLHTQYLDVNLDITFGMLLAISAVIAIIGIAVCAIAFVFLRKSSKRGRK